LYDPESAGALAAAIERLTDVTLRTRLGERARARAVSEYSWSGHCRSLDTAFRAANPTR
jgi:glycosyltransferase involved in cell wall biosynthesis